MQSAIQSKTERQGSKIDSLRHKSAAYDLKVTYQQISPQDQRLQINLKVINAHNTQSYKILLNSQNSLQIVSVLSGLDIVYECFKDETGFEVDLKGGKILVKGVFQMRGKKIPKKCLIQLQKYKASELQAMIEQIQDLQQQVVQLKKNKQQRQALLRKQYQKKFEEQKKKYEQIIASKQLQEQSAKLKQRQLQEFIEQLNSKMQNLVNKMNIFAQGNLKQLYEVKMKSQKCQKQLQATKNKLEELNLIKNGKMGRKMNKPNQQKHKSISESIQNKKQNEKQIQNMIEQNKSEMFKPLPPTINTSSLSEKGKHIDERSPWVKMFKIHQNFIIYDGQDKKQTQLLMNYPIPYGKKYQFQFNVITAKQNSIMIGVVDQNQALRKRFSDKRSTSYWAKTGYVWGANKLQGEGFKGGDIVRVIVELNKPYIQWRVNGNYAASFDPYFFQNETRVFVPFIEMENKGDCVVWNQIM